MGLRVITRRGELGMNVDVVTIGGGIGGAALATAVARSGRAVHVLEREANFKDRVRGENILPWGVAAARRLGILDDLIAAGGRLVPFFNTYFMGMQTQHRPFPATTPSGEAGLNIYHPDLQEALLSGAARAGAEVKRGASVQGITEQDGRWMVTFAEDGQTRSVTARVVIGADGRFSRMREWGGFTVRRDPHNLRIAGALATGVAAPDDGIHLCLAPGFGAFVAPFGNERARVYFVYVGATGDRKLSGKDAISALWRVAGRRTCRHLVRPDRGGRSARRVRRCRTVGFVAGEARSRLDWRRCGRHGSELGMRTLEDTHRRGDACELPRRDRRLERGVRAVCGRARRLRGQAAQHHVVDDGAHLERRACRRRAPRQGPPTHGGGPDWVPGLVRTGSLRPQRRECTAVDSRGVVNDGTWRVRSERPEAE